MDPRDEELDDLAMDYDDDDEDSMENRYLSFSIGNEEYGIEIRYVLEIIGIQNITRLPDLPDFVKGVINLRGNVIPVVDVRLRFSMTELEYNDRTCIIVVDVDRTSVGFIVDSVSEVLYIPENDREGPPELRKGSGSRFIKGMGKIKDRVIIILDVDNLLYDRELEALGSVVAE